MRTPFLRLVALGATAVLFALGSSGCSSSQTKSVNETAARNVVALAAMKEFDDRGHPLDGIPVCRSRATSVSTVGVACTATTDAGEPAALIGTTKDFRQVRGEFSGTVAGRRVFTTSCLGC